MIPLAWQEIEALALGRLEGGDRAGRIAAIKADSREVGPGDLFVALNTGVRHVEDARARGAATLVPDDQDAALAALASLVRSKSDARVVAVVGSTGKTSTKDIIGALCAPHARTIWADRSLNNEIGLPLTVCRLEPDTEILVTEMGMRGVGQIAALCEVAEPDVAAITNIGPVHLELLGTLEAIVEAKAELLAGLRDRGKAVVPADAEALAPHIHERLVAITFGPGGDVFVLRADAGGEGITALVGAPSGEQSFSFPFTEAHNLTNALAAIAIGVALEAPLAAMAERAPGIVFSRLRGERIELAGGIVIVNDCYNANPISMRAALDHLRSLVAGRRLAVLGEMAELGPDAPSYHREVGAYARELGIAPIVGVGELARDYVPDRWVPDAAAAVPALERLLEPGDAVLVKGSRAVGLELVADELLARRPK
jgi:UDP-N-acetylmuramoyl-tripeptide--D-alanyl-D-alanine ligase